MSTALHLAHAQHTPPPTKNRTKRKGGGGGSRFAQIAQRIYADDRADIRRRRADGQSVKAIAAELEFADTYLYRLLAGTRQPASDPV